MTQTERRIFLINYLLNEAKQDGVDIQNAEISDDEREQKILLHGLMNIREPKPIGEDFLKVQDEYLTERKIEKGIVTLSDIENAFSQYKSLTQINQLSTIHSPQAILWQGDITRLEVDAIVNAANSGMTGCYGWNHICIDNAIHTFAGVQLRLECDKLMKVQGHPEPTGKAKITRAYNLPSKYVIHTVGPIVDGVLNGRHEWALKSCYRSCLEVAVKNDCKSIAFCCISTGVFMFPKQRAAEIAIETVKEFVAEASAETASDIKVVFNVFGDEDRKIYEKLIMEN